MDYYTSILILCWFALAVMFVLVYENDRIPRKDKRLMYLTYLLVGVSAFAEWIGVHFDGRVDLPDWILRTAKLADYTFTPMAGGAMILQMRLKNIWQKIMAILITANAGLQLISLPAGWMVVIDAQNHYSHGPLYPIYVAICFAIIALIIVQFILYGNRFKRHNRFSVYAIMFLVMTAFAMQLLLPSGYRTVYIGMTFAVALLFIHYTEYSQLAADETMSDQRIQLMLSQIKPHFLYNTLGSIEALCDRDPGAAKLATRKFSKYLRGNMDSLSEEKLIHFEKELQHTRLYLELEQIRFGDALSVEYDIKTRNFMLPPLTLEPIAENAVKHGIRMNDDGRGTVRIVTGETPDHYQVRVIDDGPGFAPNPGPDGDTHIGIKTVRERLDRTCGGSLTIGSGPRRGTIVTIRLPKERRAE